MPQLLSRFFVILMFLAPGWCSGERAVDRTLSGHTTEAVMEPLWEVGLFNFAASIPHYRGSDESKVYAFPLPYLIYRGERVRATREGVRGIFFQSDFLETSLSLSGNPPVEDDNEAREGMPKLDAIGEIGPSIKWFVLGRDPVDKLYLRASARAAAAVAFDSSARVAYQGIAGDVGLVYFNRSLLRDQGIKFRLAADMVFGDRAYNGYFYDVAPEYATSNRSAYRSSAGFGGTSLAFSGQHDITPLLSLGAYARWDNVSGATFADSPLVRQEDNFVVGAAVILRLFRSKRFVPSEDFD